MAGEMTGRDMIMYILQNGLENEPMYKDGKLLGFMTTFETAQRLHVGESTVRAWMSMGHLPYIGIGSCYFIPSMAEVKNLKEVECKHEK